MDQEILARLGQIRERLARKTPGTWNISHYAGGFNFNGPSFVYCGTDTKGEEVGPLRIPSTYNNDNDCTLIANAPDDLLFLLNLVEKLVYK